MNKKSVLEMARPLLVEVVVTILALLILALLMLKLEWGKERIQSGVMVVYGIACFLGGLTAGKRGGKKKFLMGLVYGALYFILLWFLSLAGGRMLTGDARRIGMSFAVCAMADMAGGMFSGFISET